ncbi:hydrogenase nickel incorporation protein HypB [Candidatus Parabeggiatoa sp. HSG14]|uniref:hydrogenase nickel incorporation protein HypB n=1 Tax=Candidatus Parabeggiatoa sp. HSG14 TaxID=3055593 RepID=UPI0025A768B9|nr:hydrogenase nickel incorporation protein HypB [Thiotrichales bacterium HSG14]
MCDTCGCSITSANEEQESNTVTVLKKLLSENDQRAAHNRIHFDNYGVLCINLMSSPGSGKTALLETTIEALRDKVSIAVIEGDLETENDAERIRAKGVPAIQIATGTACHLDAQMVHRALHQIDLTGLDILFIENVGNLVCPASFDLGQHCNVTLLSVTEGDDKPAKYPVMFRASDLVVLSKIDLLPVLDDFSPANVENNLKALAKNIPLIQLSAKKQQGFEDWLNWLHNEIQQNKNRVSTITVPAHSHSEIHRHAA